MRPQLTQFSDQSLQQLVRELTAILGNINTDNFNSFRLTGSTAASNASRKFRHGLNAQPSMVLILEGNAYVAKDGVGPNEVDIRTNAGTAQSFLALVVR